MMEVLTITSESHDSQFIQTFGEFFKENVLTDVTLVCDDQVRIDAHKIVLSAGSHFFREMFVNNPHSHPLLYLRGLKEQELLSILQFLYVGETSLNKDSVPQFLSVAKEFEISGLETETENSEPEVDQAEEESNLKMTTPKPSQQKADSTFKDAKEDSTVPRNKKKPLYFCDKCQYTAPGSSDLKRHKTKCSVASTTKDLQKIGGENYPCEACDFRAQSKSKLAEHKVAVHAVSCSHCHTKFQSEAAMVKHRRAKHEAQPTPPAPTAMKVPEQKLACHQCRFVSSRMDLLREHVINTHAKI